MSDDPDWLGAATDLLEERGLDEAAGVLRAAPARGELLERAVQAMEAMARHFLEFRGHVPLAVGPILPLIAEHRGETVEATLARLTPSLKTGWSVDYPRAVPGTITMSGFRVINESADDDVGHRPGDINLDTGAIRLPDGRVGRFNNQAEEGSRAIQEYVSRAADHDRRQVEAFLRENHADPAIHERVVHREPAGDTVHILVPLGDRPEGGPYLTVAEMVARYPHIRIAGPASQLSRVTPDAAGRNT